MQCLITFEHGDFDVARLGWRPTRSQRLGGRAWMLLGLATASLAASIALAGLMSVYWHLGWIVLLAGLLILPLALLRRWLVGRRNLIGSAADWGKSIYSQTEPVTFTLDEQGVQESTCDRVVSYPWASVVKVVESASAWTVVTHAGFVVLPARCLSSQQQQTLRDVLQERAVPQCTQISAA